MVAVQMSAGLSLAALRLRATGSKRGPPEGHHLRRCWQGRRRVCATSSLPPPLQLPTMPALDESKPSPPEPHHFLLGLPGPAMVGTCAELTSPTDVVSLLLSSKALWTAHGRHLLAVWAVRVYGPSDALVRAAKAGAAGVVVEILRLKKVGANHMGAIAMRWAALKGHAAVVEVLVDAGADVEAEGGEPLWLAAREGRGEVVAVLLLHGADVTARDGAALEAAAEGGHVRVLEQLLAALSSRRPQLPPPQGADERPAASGQPESTGSGSGQQESAAGSGSVTSGPQLQAILDRAMLAAARRGSAAGVYALLLAGAHASVNDSRALHLAVDRRNVAMAATLLACGADTGSRGSDAVVWAAERGCPDLLDLLLQAGGDGNAKDGLPLINAAKDGDEDVMGVLLARGADPRRRQDGAIELAAIYGHEGCVRQLLGAGVPAAAAASRPWLDVVVRRAHVGVLGALVAHGLVVPARTAALAAELGDEEVVAVLGARGRRHAKR